MQLQESFFAHSHALIEKGASIGEGTRVWAFTHILAGARIGRGCNICDHVFIENDVIVGDRVTVKCGVQLWDGLRVDNDCFIGPNATFTNDRYPRSKKYPETSLVTCLSQGASIGANATILPGIRIGERAMIAAGAVVTKDVPDYALVKGNPGRVSGWICGCGEKLNFSIADRARCACGNRFLRSSDERAVSITRESDLVSLR